MAAFQLRILTENGTFFEGECESLTVPSLDGRLGILAHRAPMIAALIPGELQYRPLGDEMHIAAISSGLVKVENNVVLVLTDAAEHPEEIDAERARRSAQAAQETLHQERSMWEHSAAEAALARAVTRIKIKESSE